MGGGGGEGGVGVCYHISFLSGVYGLSLLPGHSLKAHCHRLLNVYF